MHFEIRNIKPEDDKHICHIIKTVGAEFGAIGDGFGPSDEEVECMSQYYKEADNALYLVAVKDNQLIGGGGIAAFHKSTTICELRKLFLLPESRGLGIGKKLTKLCLEYAQSRQYQQCYLDTLSNMKPAITLYKRFGFRHLQEPLNETIHSGCDVWMLKELREP